MKNVSIKFLGTQDGTPSGDRHHASILMRVAGRVYLLDCGEPVSHNLARSGAGFEQIDRVFLTHMHADHCGGFPMLLQAMWLSGRQKPLPVHLPAEGVEWVETTRRTMYLFDEALPYTIGLVPLKAGSAVEDGGNRVIPHHTTHLAGMRKLAQAKYKQPFESFSLRIEAAGGTSVVYSGDLGAAADLIPALAPRTDLLITELAHFSPESLFGFLSAQDVGRIIVTHVGLPAQNPAMKTLAAKMLGDRVVFAEDGMEVTV